ncbi:hypothetical protein [Lysobacter sp. 22409]|uniref:hypothetical protein n=1 Tax=Lysobacter sp. 22409 TaxID=3453917 RepID=UPI003F862F46
MARESALRSLLSRWCSYRWWLAGACAVALCACGEPAADVSRPLSYDRLGVHMSIPGNWSMAEDKRVDAVHYMIVESPGAAMFVAIVQADTTAELEDFARDFSAEADKATPSVMNGHSRFDRSAFAEGTIREHYTLSLGGVKVPHRREYRKITGAHRTAFLITQSADEDLPQTQPGFDLLLKSFKLADAPRAAPGDATR